MKLPILQLLAKPGPWAVMTLAALGGYAISLPAAEPSPTAPLVSLSDLMEAVLNPAASEIWNAALFEPAEGADKVVPTEEQWLNLRYNALRVLTVPPALMHPELPVATPGAVAAPGELSPEAIAALRLEKAAAWDAQVGILRQSALAALTAIDAKDLDAMLQAGDTLYAVCESCHQQFWYPPAP